MNPRFSIDALNHVSLRCYRPRMGALKNKQKTEIDRCAVDFRLLFVFESPSPHAGRGVIQAPMLGSATNAKFGMTHVSCARSSYARALIALPGLRY